MYPNTIVCGETIWSVGITSEGDMTPKALSVTDVDTFDSGWRSADHVAPLYVEYE